MSVSLLQTNLQRSGAGGVVARPAPPSRPHRVGRQLGESSLVQGALPNSRLASNALSQAASAGGMHSDEQQRSRSEHHAARIQAEMPKAEQHLLQHPALQAQASESALDSAPNSPRQQVIALLQIVVEQIELRHWTLLMICSCLALTMIIACSRQPSHIPVELRPLPKSSCFGRPLQELGPTAALKEQVVYTCNPENCLHEDGLRKYVARKQSLRICDKCGSRWMLQRGPSSWVPITPKSAPEDVVDGLLVI